MIAVFLRNEPPSRFYYIAAACVGAFTAYYWTDQFWRLTERILHG